MHKKTCKWFMTFWFSNFIKENKFELIFQLVLSLFKIFLVIQLRRIREKKITNFNIF